MSQASDAMSIDELIASTSSASVVENKPAEEGTDGVPVSMADILRLRKKSKMRRVGGVEFRAEAGAGGHILRDEDRALLIHRGNEDEGREGEMQVERRGVPRKFAPQTGAAGDVNKHM